ncbi:exported hypothetical protein [Xenorhabdus cabanillasii JM26]|uniref:Uncharacterized protein n=1 Tax=Xenorhabdus cabanillasii JM26 TaxID=1427517 RepID=W1J6H4_9GAMM|nr:exported hypothetical protein [Xenorhabdus cabanillasii JM26]
MASEMPSICATAVTAMLYGGSNLASAADLRSGEIRVIFFSISVVNEGDNYADREGGKCPELCPSLHLDCNR